MEFLSSLWYLFYLEFGFFSTIVFLLVKYMYIYTHLLKMSDYFVEATSFVYHNKLIFMGIVWLCT